jgi:hypothetical protein
MSGLSWWIECFTLDYFRVASECIYASCFPSWCCPPCGCILSTWLRFFYQWMKYRLITVEIFRIKFVQTFDNDSYQLQSWCYALCKSFVNYCHDVVAWYSTGWTCDVARAHDIFFCLRYMICLALKCLHQSSLSIQHIANFSGARCIILAACHWWYNSCHVRTGTGGLCFAFLSYGIGGLSLDYYFLRVAPECKDASLPPTWCSLGMHCTNLALVRHQ